MSYYVFALLVALLVCEEQIIVGKAENECRDDYKQFQESCYRLSSTEATRPDAAAACTPGHLVDITSEEEQDFIAGILTENRIRGAWFGLLKSLSWSDGSSLVQESWQNIRANAGRQCFRLERNENYLWNDKNCDERYYSICEYEISDSEECRQGFGKFNRSCYQINDDTLTRSDAAAACGTSHLADITSIEERDFVVGLLIDSGRGDAWFGLTLSDPPSWSDGSLLLSASWHNIKTGGNSVCYRLDDEGFGVYSWNDAESNSCRDTYRFVCEYEAVMSTRPYTVATTNATFSDLTGNLAQTGVTFGTSLGIVVLLIICVSAIAIIYYRRKSTTKRYRNNSTDLETPTTQPSHQDPKQVPDYQNVSNPKIFKSTDDNDGPEAIYHYISENKFVKYDDVYAPTEAAIPGTADQYHYAYASRTEASIPAVNPSKKRVC